MNEFVPHRDSERASTLAERIAQDRFAQELRPHALGPELAAALGDDRWLTFEAHLIAGGKSNLTFMLRAGDARIVLRRPPTGILLPKAHDMARECRILHALATTMIPVPRVLHEAGADSVLAVPYYVMEMLDGVVIRDDLPPEWADSVEDRVAIADVVVDTLAALHELDPASIGLDGYGRPAGFMERQVELWVKQRERAARHDVPAATALAAQLRRRIPAARRVGIVHGDYRLDNCIFDVVHPGRIAAVLDWELSTLGDPLADVGMLMFYWRHPDEEPWMLAPAPTRAMGFPRRDALLNRYLAQTGDDADLRFYEAFAHLKFAAITQGVATRVAAGAMAGQNFGDLDGEVERIAEAGLEILNRK